MQEKKYGVKIIKNEQQNINNERMKLEKQS